MRQCEVPILIYTHSDYRFMWPALVGQMKKYVKDIKIYFGYNDKFKDINNSNIPNDWNIITYNEDLIWTKRILSLLQQTPGEHVLFLHEDWIPVNNVSPIILNDLANWMKLNSCNFLMSYAHYPIDDQAGIESGYENYKFYKSQNHVFQPAMWNKNIFINFCTDFNKTKVQNEERDCLTYMDQRNCWSIQNCKTMATFRTTNSLMYPHMHVLSQGLWNSTKYPTLLTLLESYGIDTSTRGAHSWWELDHQ